MATTVEWQSSGQSASGPSHFEFAAEPGFFQQGESTTDAATFDFQRSDFGLVSRAYDTDGHGEEPSTRQWQRFEKHVRERNAAAPEGECYKVLFLGRHGQGVHNVAETKYGTKAWDCYWSALPGADGLDWDDALLTPLGEQQARDASAVWARLLPLGIPAPETYYVSPLTRTIQTADLTFSTLSLPPGRPYKPLIKELLREVMGVHTCDRRSPKTHIAKTFPHVTFEPGFVETDELWQADYREPHSAREYRYARLLDDIFAHDSNVFLSLTCHSGAISSMLTVLGHRAFYLETGGVIPVLVRARRVYGERAVPVKEPSDAPELWKEPPPADHR